MQAMLSLHLSLQLRRHFSIRVSSLRKQSLVAQLLRGNDSPKLTKLTQKGGLNGTQQGEASLRSVYQHSPLGVSVEQNGKLQEQRLAEDDACLAKLSVRESKEAQNRDGAKGSKAHRSNGDTQLPVLSKLSVLSLREGSKAHHNVGDAQPSVRAQTGSRRGSYEAKLFQTESRKVGPAKVSVQSQIAREEGYDSHGPVDSKPGSRGGKRLALRTGGASQKPCLPISKLSISPLRTGSSKELASHELGKCITGNGSTTERGEQDDELTAIKHSLSLMNSAALLGRETSKQSKVKNSVEVHSVIRKHRITKRFLHDLRLKIELVSQESAPLTHVKALLVKRAFICESPKKLAEVLTVLKLFFESDDKAHEILTVNTGIVAQPLEQLQQRLQVLVEFEVDKATRYRLGTRRFMMMLKVENYRSVLSFLEELGLSAESRNRMICKYPQIMGGSVENHMQQTVNFLESLGTPRPRLLKLVQSCPSTLCFSNNLMVMHKVFQHVGLSSEEFVKALKLMGQYSSQHCFSRYNFFREQGFSDVAVANMVKRNPNILTMAEETLKAKLHFLLHTGKWDISEIVAFPAYFKYSLASRIIPRIKILEELNLPRWPSLSTILTCTMSKFMTKLKISDSSKCI